VTRRKKEEGGQKRKRGEEERARRFPLLPYFAKPSIRLSIRLHGRGGPAKEKGGGKRKMTPPGLAVPYPSLIISQERASIS